MIITTDDTYMLSSINNLLSDEESEVTKEEINTAILLFKEQLRKEPTHFVMRTD